ncbi:MAG: YaeQ family protein [Pseudobdellovibrio sp.]
MSVATVLYRFRIDMSDIDRGYYNKLDFRLALHPSESILYFLTRALAFALSADDDLEFSSAGLNDPEGPTVFIKEPSGHISLWIEIGNPSIKKLHKASKAASVVKVYTYKDAQLIINEGQTQQVHNAQAIQIYAFDPKFLERLAKNLPRDIRWSVIHNERILTVSSGNESEETEIKSYNFK